VGDRHAVIAARGGGDTRGADRAQEQVGECASRLEGASVLQLLELQRDREPGETEIGRVDLHDRGRPEVWSDDGRRGRDRRSGDVSGLHGAAV
jgi:hypothetical protein